MNTVKQAVHRWGALKPLPCRLCGWQPHLRSVNVHFRPSDGYLFTQIEIECSNPECSKKHRHFGKYATRREAIKAWNATNKTTGGKA